jgi:amino acid transporter
MLSVPRIVYAMARDGFLPRIFAHVDPVHRSPRAAIAFHAVVTLAFATTNTFEKLAVLANVSALALYLGCAISSWRLGQSPLVPILASAVIAWLLTGMTVDEWIAFGTCVAMASVVYVVARPERAAADGADQTQMSKRRGRA